MASGSRQPPKGVRPMSAREREPGELPSPICPCLIARSGRDLFFLDGNIEHPTFNTQHPMSAAPALGGKTGCSPLDVGCWMFDLRPEKNTCPQSSLRQDLPCS